MPTAYIYMRICTSLCLLITIYPSRICVNLTCKKKKKITDRKRDKRQQEDGGITEEKNAGRTAKERLI